MEPITGTVAATGAATSASAASGGATVSAATAAKQADAIRRLASAFIKSAEMKVVGESELVDEFASPIYAGLAAVPTGSTPQAQGSSALNAGGSMPELVATSTPPIPGMPEIKPGDRTTGGLIVTNGEPLTIDKTPTKGPEPTNRPEPMPITSDDAPVLSVEKPEVKELVDRYYDAPTIKDQLEAGNDKIVIERKLLDEKVVINGDKRTAWCLIEERVVDRRYLEHGNLTDLISEVRHGHIPTIRQLYLAIIDLADLATFKVFRPLLARVKVEPATYRLRELSADLERKTLEPTLERETESQVKLDRKEESRSWFKTDHVIEKIGHTDVETKKEVEIVALNVTNLCTVEMNHGAIEGLLTRRSELNDMFGDSNSLVRIENMLPPETITEINRSAMAWVRENLCSTTSKYTTVETFNRYKVDLDGFLGKKIEMSDKQVTERVQTNLTEYLSPSDIISLEHIDTYQQALEKFASVQKTMELKFDPQIVNTYVVPSEGVTFDDGWLTYIPGGSIVNLGVKTDLGAKITGMDVFWAAVDVATIALAIASCGTSTAVTSAGMAAGKAAVKGGVKAVAKASTKAAAKASAKAAAKASAKTAAKAAAKTTVKQTGRVAIKNTSKVGAKVAKAAGTKANVAKSATGTAVKSSTNKVATQAAKTEASTTTKTVVGKEAQASAENSVKQSGKVKINNSGTAGSKAKPSVDVSQPDVTYKNIPRNKGEWTGTPGDSTWKPDPKVKPANTKVNPTGKTNEQILKENNMKNGVKFKDGCPDFSDAAKEQVKVTNMSTNRTKNFAQADSQLAEKVRAGKADQRIVQMLERNGVDPKTATKGDIARLRSKEGLTWHEHQDKQTMQLIHKELHGTIPHRGGISVLKQEEKLAAQAATSAASESANSTAMTAGSTALSTNS